MPDHYPGLSCVCAACRISAATGSAETTANSQSEPTAVRATSSRKPTRHAAYVILLSRSGFDRIRIRLYTPAHPHVTFATGIIRRWIDRSIDRPINRFMQSSVLNDALNTIRRDRMLFLGTFPKTAYNNYALVS